MKKRIPFNDELDNFNQLDKIIALLPPHLRPKRSQNITYKEIHEAARADLKMRNTSDDGIVHETPEEAALRKQTEEKV